MTNGRMVAPCERAGTLGATAVHRSPQPAAQAEGTGPASGRVQPAPSTATTGVRLGATVEEVEREMRAAIALHLEGLAADGESIPEPSGSGVYVERTAVA
jgi:predicted RNase H-like HicB family nuclease